MAGPGPRLFALFDVLQYNTDVAPSIDLHGWQSFPLFHITGGETPPR
jgi:hypothetical protein